MSEFVWSWEGEEFALDVLFGAVAKRDFYLIPYKSDTIPSKSSTYSSFTVCDDTYFSGLATLADGSGWTVTVGSGTTKTYVTWTGTTPAFDWSDGGSYSGSGEYVYGYIIYVSSGGNVLLGGQRFTSRMPIHASATLDIVPKLIVSDLKSIT